MSESAPPPAPARTERVARAVPAMRALAWYAEAMRLWRVSPAVFAGLAFATIGAQFLVRLVPAAGVVLEQLVVPLVECSLLYASLAADRGDRPRLRHLLAILGAPARSQVAVVLANLVAFAAQAVVARALADIDLLEPNAFGDSVSALTIVGVVATGLVVSLPVAFVPPIALFDDAGIAASFRGSLEAFTRNIAPLAVYAALSIGLFLFGILTSGLGLLLVLPWLAASSYAAWKDVFGVATPRTS